MDSICSPEMPRRSFMAMISGGLLAAPLAAEAQQAGKIWRIGYLDGSSPSARGTLIEAFKDRLRELGHAPSQYVLDSRYAEGYDERLPELAADLVRGKPDVILAVGPSRQPGRLAPFPWSSSASATLSGPVSSRAWRGLPATSPESRCSPSSWRASGSRS